MANKFGLGSTPLATKKLNTTAWINKAKPYFVDQIGDTLQGDIDMNNFTITNLKSPENDNDAVHKKYVLDQINLIESGIDEDHLKDKISDVKRFFKRQLNNKDFIDDTKLQQEVTSLKSFIQQQLVNVVDKTQLQSLSKLISQLDDKIAKQKLDLKQLIDNIAPGVNEDTLQREITSLETKNNTELQKEINNIKTYIQQQIQDSEQQITTINNEVLKQEKKINILENKENKPESYSFRIPFESGRFKKVSADYDIYPIYELKTYGFIVKVKVDTYVRGNPEDIFKIGLTYPGDPNTFYFRERALIEIIFPMKAKVDSIFFIQESNTGIFYARKILQFINDGEYVENKTLESNDENSNVDHLYEIKTNGQYIDTFKMSIISDYKNDIIALKSFIMILTPELPSMNIIRKPTPNEEKQEGIFEFIRTTDFEYVKLYFEYDDKYTSVDVHKSQENKVFNVTINKLLINIFDCTFNITIDYETLKISPYLNKKPKQKTLLVRVNVSILSSSIMKINPQGGGSYEIYKPFPISEVHLIST
ncbi:hypothetical protein LOTGIDRAFT_155883 [Lottia gigantea]|uniref:Uncharacterized protein n=1 Tax=Lottia gigantea TaxID=225164 RepID=V3ZFJ9_LOTGI|nr:hypothetical protein LOTGIDRAFT_155883 [Lottia gigantea]ESO82847.1 hypothetical protein LOTGIDRAFT_155883 [Lottia gigantea]